VLAGGCREGFGGIVQANVRSSNGP
jgi:hypothetical protein